MLPPTLVDPNFFLPFQQQHRNLGPKSISIHNDKRDMFVILSSSFFLLRTSRAQGRRTKTGVGNCLRQGRDRPRGATVRGGICLREGRGVGAVPLCPPRACAAPAPVRPPQAVAIEGGVARASRADNRGGGRRREGATARLLSTRQGQHACHTPKFPFWVVNILY